MFLLIICVDMIATVIFINSSDMGNVFVLNILNGIVTLFGFLTISNYGKNNWTIRHWGLLGIAL